MKVILVLAACALAFAEPPVNTRYLPPSSTYGAPRHTDAVFRSRPSSSYGAPRARRPSYRTPSLSSSYLPPSTSYGLPSSPSNQYGPPSSPSNQYGPPSSPSNQYGPPSSLPTQYAPTPDASHLTTPAVEYGTPSVDAGFGSTAADFAGTSLSTPAFSSHSVSNSYGAPAQSRKYLPPSGGRGYDSGNNGEPANYNFEYMVKDAASGNDFGHRESRKGDRAEGTYYVVLPDGRKQTVQYEADQDGYRPKVTYEDTGSKQSGYSRNGQSSLQGGYRY